MVAEAEKNDRIEYTVEVVSAYVANNSVSPEELPELIGQVYATLAGWASLSRQNRKPRSQWFRLTNPLLQITSFVWKMESG